MASNRRKLIPMLGRAALLIGVGAGAYAALEAADSALTDFTSAPPPAPGVLPVADAPGAATGDRSGSVWLERALVRLEQRRSVAVDIVQSGWIDGRLIETNGVYRRAGSGLGRRFSYRLQGSVDGRPARISRVSDSRFLHTDIHWGGGDEGADRLVTKVDLRVVRRQLAENNAPPEAGSAVARLASPLTAMRWGGVPMLLASLNRAFDFSAGREMRLRGERVVAMVGHWNPDRYDDLLGERSAAIPERAPHHVVLALSRDTLFPLLIEYRSSNDPLSTNGLADESLLRPSGRPMLKLDFLRPVFDPPIPETEFAYAAPDGAPLRDETDRELRIVKAANRRLASTSSDARR